MKVNKNSLTLNLITRFYNYYVEDENSRFTDFELILLIKLILDLRDFSDLESDLC